MGWSTVTGFCQLSTKTARFSVHYKIFNSAWKRGSDSNEHMSNSMMHTVPWLNNRECSFTEGGIALDLPNETLRVISSVVCLCLSRSGYRSVPLKNGYSENLELASLLVYVDIQQVEVREDHNLSASSHRWLIYFSLWENFTFRNPLLKTKPAQLHYTSGQNTSIMSHMNRITHRWFVHLKMFWLPESRRGAVLFLQPTEEKTGWAVQRALLIRHAHRPPARCTLESPRRPHAGVPVEWESAPEDQRSMQAEVSGGKLALAPCPSLFDWRP